MLSVIIAECCNAECRYTEFFERTSNKKIKIDNLEKKSVYLIPLFFSSFPHVAQFQLQTLLLCSTWPKFPILTKTIWAVPSHLVEKHLADWHLVNAVQKRDLSTYWLLTKLIKICVGQMSVGQMGFDRKTLNQLEQLSKCCKKSEGKED
jgi:hypothetical protein